MRCGLDTEANIETACGPVRGAAAKGARLILLQELFETPYFCAAQHPEHFKLAQPFEAHPMIARFAALARELNVVLSISFFEKTGRQFFNTVARIGVAICWDKRFPEAARAMALQGADVIPYPTAIGSAPSFN